MPCACARDNLQGSHTRADPNAHHARTFPVANGSARPCPDALAHRSPCPGPFASTNERARAGSNS